MLLNGRTGTKAGGFCQSWCAMHVCMCIWPVDLLQDLLPMFSFFLPPHTHLTNERTFSRGLRCCILACWEFSLHEKIPNRVGKHTKFTISSIQQTIAVSRHPLWVTNKLKITNTGSNPNTVTQPAWRVRPRQESSLRVSGGRGGVQTHGKAASVSASMHPLHVHHGSEQTDVVVHSTERLHAFKQLERSQTLIFNTFVRQVKLLNDLLTANKSQIQIRHQQSLVIELQRHELLHSVKTSEMTQICWQSRYSPLWSSAGQSWQGAATGSGKVWSEAPPSHPTPTSWWSACDRRIVCQTPRWRGRASGCMLCCVRWRDLLPEMETDKRAADGKRKRSRQDKSRAGDEYSDCF